MPGNASGTISSLTTVTVGASATGEASASGSIASVSIVTVSGSAIRGLFAYCDLPTLTVASATGSATNTLIGNASGLIKSIGVIATEYGGEISATQFTNWLR